MSDANVVVVGGGGVLKDAVETVGVFAFLCIFCDDLKKMNGCVRDELESTNVLMCTRCSKRNISNSIHSNSPAQDWHRPW